MPAGKWTVEFANGVTEVCFVGSFGTAMVAEPRRKAQGTIAVQEGTAVITFDDDRVECWTAVGKRFVVEHWVVAQAQPLQLR